MNSSCGETGKQAEVSLLSSFSSSLNCNSGPANSNADLTNARKDGFSLDVGNGAIICDHGFDFRRRHTKHSFSHSRISSRPASNQYRVDNAASVWLVPVAWFLRS